MTYEIADVAGIAGEGALVLLWRQMGKIRPGNTRPRHEDISCRRLTRSRCQWFLGLFLREVPGSVRRCWWGGIGMVRTETMVGELFRIAHNAGRS